MAVSRTGPDVPERWLMAGQPWQGQPWQGQPWQQRQSAYAQAAPALAPGAVPLRPLGVGEILSGSFTLIRQNPSATLGLTASAMTALGVSLVIIFFVATHAAAVAVLAAPLVLLFSGVQFGALVAAMGRSFLGHKVTIRNALRWSRPGWVILTALMLATLFVGGWALLIIALKGWGAVVALLLTAWLAVMLSLTIPAVVLEGRRPFAAIGRSWRLVLGSYWRVFGIYLLTYLIMWMLSFIVSLPLIAIGGLVGITGADGRTTLTLAFAAQAIGEIVIASLALTIETGVVVLVYADMRMRKEGMDLVLQQAAQNHQLTGNDFAATGLSSAYTGGAYLGSAYHGVASANPAGPQAGGAGPSPGWPVSGESYGGWAGPPTAT